METKEKLKAIANKQRLTADDKQFVIELAAELGVEFEPKKGCSDCYKDMAVVLYGRLPDEEGESERRYLLRDGIDVYWGTLRVNNTCSDEELEDYLQRGFPKQLYKRIDGEDGRWL